MYRANMHGCATRPGVCREAALDLMTQVPSAKITEKSALCRGARPWPQVVSRGGVCTECVGAGAV